MKLCLNGYLCSKRKNKKSGVLLQISKKQREMKPGLNEKCFNNFVFASEQIFTFLQKSPDSFRFRENN
jgi:hypothetical protein